MIELNLEAIVPHITYTGLAITALVVAPVSIWVNRKLEARMMKRIMTEVLRDERLKMLGRRI